MEKIIAIDLDEVVAELIEWALKFNNFQINWKPATKEDIEDYYIENMKKYWLDRQGAIDRFYWFVHSEWMHDIGITPWAKTKILQLKTKWYLLYILTARREERTDITKARLNKNIPGVFDDKNIIFANHFTDKSRSKWDICNEIWATIMIEDNLDYARELSTKWVTTYLLRKPRNKQYDNSDPKIIHVDWRNDINL